MVQEIFGVNSHIRSVADGYAAEGYLAVAPATFHRVKQGVELGYTEDDMKAGFGAQDRGRGAAARRACCRTSRPRSTTRRKAGKVGIVGYCWGGLLTWRAAAVVSGLSAAAPYYGGGMTTPEESALQAQGAGAGALRQQRPLDSAATPSRPSRRRIRRSRCTSTNAATASTATSAARTTPAAAKLARERTLAFFAKHLG